MSAAQCPRHAAEAILDLATNTYDGPERREWLNIARTHALLAVADAISGTRPTCPACDADVSRGIELPVIL